MMISACTMHESVAKVDGIKESLAKAVGNDESDAKLNSAINSGNLEQVKEALEDGANINKIKVSLISEENPVIIASIKGEDKVAKYLIENGADVNYTDSSGLSLLMFQAYNTDYTFCELLINNGAKTDAEDKKGYTALEHVLEHSRRGTTEKNIDNIISLLLENGAKIKPITLKVALNVAKSKNGNMYKVVNKILKELIKYDYKSELNPILEGAILGDSLRINELIKDNQMKKEDEQQILFYTAAFGSIETMKLLENKGIDVNSGDKFKNSTLIVASEYGNFEMVKYLFGKGVNIEARNMDKESALFNAVKNEQYGIAKYLINQGADIKPFAVFAGTIDVLSEASTNGNIDMLKLIIANGYPLSEKNMEKAMEAACRNNNINVVKYLLDMGAKSELKYLQSIKSESNEGLDIVKVLVEHGAKVDGENSDGTPLKYSHSKEISEYLIEKGANVNAVSNLKNGKKGESILMSTIMTGDLDRIKLLVENGADLEYKDENCDKDTVIMWAVAQGSRHILEYLIQKGANINYQNEKGETALMKAVSGGYLSNVKMLIKYNADINLKNNEGQTVLDIAEASNYEEIANLLRNIK